MNTISINYKTAPVEIRQIFAFTIDEQKAFMKDAVSKEDISECVMLCTCNRMEVYFQGGLKSVEIIQQMLCEARGIKLSMARKYFNVYCDENAVRHLFKVTGGIDSMVIGEDEILGQVKEAHALALENETTSFVTNTVFKMAVTGAKKAKTLTGISRTPVSIATLTANKVFTLEKPNKTILIIGVSGKMGSTVAKNLLSKPNIKVLGTLRGHNMGENLEARYENMTYVPYCHRYKYMEEADVIISATSSPHFTVTAQEFIKNVKNHKDKLFIDLAVPNDIDREIGEIERVSLFNIDYFETLAKENNEKKLKEAQSAQELLDKYCDDALKELVFRKFLPKLPLIKEYFEENGVENGIYNIRKNESKDVLVSVIMALEKLMGAESI